MIRAAWSRAVRLATAVSAGVLILALILLWRDLLRFIPIEYHRWWVEFLALAALAAYLFARVMALAGFRVRARLCGRAACSARSTAWPVARYTEGWSPRSALCAWSSSPVGSPTISPGR